MPLISIGVEEATRRFDLTDLPSYLFAVPLPEIEAARLLSWKPTLVYACLGMDYTSARMVPRQTDAQSIQTVATVSGIFLQLVCNGKLDLVCT